jgi:hypothetical protein
MNDREAFEKWAQGKSLLINIREEMMYAAGGYINVKEMAWEAWQAALQSGEPVGLIEGIVSDRCWRSRTLEVTFHTKFTLPKEGESVALLLAGKEKTE